MLYIFTQDNGWAGCIVVVAKNEEDARAKMQHCENYNYNSNEPVKKHEIQEGFLFCNTGDLGLP